MAHPYIYFLKPAGMVGPIKIGCSDLPERRLRAFVAWSPLPLEIAARAPGGFSIEKWLHYRFRDARSHGEWFWPVASLCELIEAVKATGSIPESPRVLNEPIGVSDLRPLRSLLPMLNERGLTEAQLADAVGLKVATVKTWRKSGGIRAAARAAVGLEHLGVVVEPEALIGVAP